MCEIDPRTKTKPPAQSKLSGFFLNAPVFLVIAMGAIHLLDKYGPITLWLFMPWKMLGWLPIAVGSVLCLTGAGRFRRHATTINPHGTSQTLVTDGIYRLTRNPMYLGLLLIVLGITIIAGSASVWVVPPAFAVAIDRSLIRHEEKRLAERFGEAYDDYRQRVRRWI